MPSCQQALNIAELLAYWLGELADERSSAIEEHFFACKSCSAQLEKIVSLGTGLRSLILQGKIASVLTPAFLEKLKAAGLRIREYRLEPQGSVNCTIAPQDDLVVAHLRAPLAGVGRLDLLLDDPDTAQQLRLTDIGFDPANGGIVVMPRAEELRGLHQATQRMRLLSIEASGERLLGEYVFKHSRYSD